MRLKVCGLTQVDQINELISMNVDFLGFIFYHKSPRYVLRHLTLKNISHINHQGKIGVFVNENSETILEIAEKADLNFVQLHGDEDQNFVSELRKKINPDIRIIKVIRIGNQSSDELEKTIKRHQKTTSYLLFDTDSETFGGTGQQFDWNLLNEIELPLPYFLSGGISLENIEILNTLKQTPFSLDVNSKFETKPGIKDVEKIKKFILNHEKSQL